MKAMNTFRDISFQRRLRRNRIKGKNAVFNIINFLLKKKTRGPALHFIHTVYTYFFLPQFQTKFKIKTRPVVWVDHELDRKIPFSPHHVETYLSFTHLWIKSLAFVYRQFGRQVLPDIVDFVKGIDTLYQESARVYTRIQSTTDRPHDVGGFYFKVIHLFDPHLHCIPSLHVCVVGYTYVKIREIVARYAEKPEDFEEEIDYLWRQTIHIADSILFIKQHSVNCVSAGLFTLTAGNYGFTIDHARKVIRALFSQRGRTLEAAEELRSFISELYEHFLEEHREKSQAQVLLDFLRNYRQITGKHAGCTLAELQQR
jgi:hypothetical protein